MRKIFLATTALLLSAAPAHAQLLGGGLGGTLGGTIGGTLGGVGSIGGPVDTVTSTARGTLRGSGATSGSQNVDRKSGRVQAQRSADAGAAGDIAQTAGTPTRLIDGNASGAASGSGSGSIDTQLIGTDAVGSTVQSLRGTAGGAAQSGLGAAGDAGGLTGGLTGTLTRSGGASGSGAAGPIGGSGSASGTGEGAFSVTRGTPILAPDGDRIGRVRQIFTNASAEIEQLLVKVDGQTALVPAANFSASGNAIVSAMTESQIKQLSDQQDGGSETAPVNR